MSEHVILLNSGKTDAYCHLVKFVPGDRVDVITERKYTPLYPHDANLHYVHDIADVTKVLDVARKLDSSRPITAASLNCEYDCEASESIPGIVANIDLPVQTGRLVDISTIDELSSVDGFISADLAPVGTCFSEPLNSSSATGVAYVQLHHDTELAEVLRQLKSRYHAAYES